MNAVDDAKAIAAAIAALRRRIAVLPREDATNHER
jgi:hypothetical protein